VAVLRKDPDLPFEKVHLGPVAVVLAGDRRIRICQMNGRSAESGGAYATCASFGIPEQRRRIGMSYEPPANLNDPHYGRGALRMIRHTIEEFGPAGVLISEEAVLGR
jgi:hypothetical protein